jgi:hypothetical protein
MKRVLLATVTENNQCSVAFTNALVQTVREGLHTEVEVLPIFLQSAGNWAMAANQAMTLAWQNELDGLVLVGPNVSWNPETLLQLCSTDKDAAAVPIATRNGFNVGLGEVARLQEDEKTGEIKVSSASLGFFYLSAYSLRKLCETHPTVSYQGQDAKLILQSGDIYASYHTHEEVLAFRLRELGIEIWLNPAHTACRQELVEQQGDFAALLRNLKENG